MTGGQFQRFHRNRIHYCGCDTVGYEEFYLLGYNACLPPGFTLGLFLDPEDGDDIFLRNVG
jgi:hypothetical protein